MKAELEERLVEEFPFMRKAHSLEEQEKQGGIFDLYGAFGCECGSGWYDLLRGLCGELSGVYHREGIPVDIIMDQVKQKWGGLRFYYHHSGQKPHIQAIDFMGNGGLRFRAADPPLYREISEIVAKWEKYSYQVCEWCGAPGILREDLRWVRTLCGKCYEKVLEGERKLPKWPEL